MCMFQPLYKHCNAHPNCTATPSDATRPVHARRQSTLDQETVEKLEKRLNERPEKTQLVDRNILKGKCLVLHSGGVYRG